MTSKRVVMCFFVALCLALPRCLSGRIAGSLRLPSADDFLEEEILDLDDSRYLSELQEFEDATIELDFIEERTDRRNHRRRMKKPRIIYQVGNKEDDLPICSGHNVVCSKVDLYNTPWIERQCRCPNGHECPSELDVDDGQTIVDKTRQYKLCEPVNRLPTCRYFRDTTWTVVSNSRKNTTVQKVHCQCPPGSVSYLLRPQRQDAEKNQVSTFDFVCSPRSKLRCDMKEPCRLFTVRKKYSAQVDEVNASLLCQCPKGHRCPKRHTDPGSILARSYAPETKTYTGYCTPVHRQLVYTVV